MTTTRRLEEGQFEIGTTIFGRGTDYPVSSFEISSPESIPGDYQGPQADDIRFTQDYLTPSTVSWEMGVIANKLLANIANPQNIQTIEGLVSGRVLKERLVAEWRADEIRKIWGSVKPFRYNQEGQTRIIYGRPRKIMTNAASRKAEFYNVVCDFQRSDTRSYLDRVDSVGAIGPFGTAKGGTITRNDGDAATWCDIYIIGPFTNPTIVIGGVTITIAASIAAGKMIVLSSVPWERKLINSDGVNLAASLTTPYLEDISIPPDATVSWSAIGTGTTAASQVVIQWREAYHDI